MKRRRITGDGVPFFGSIHRPWNVHAKELSDGSSSFHVLRAAVEAKNRPKEKKNRTIHLAALTGHTESFRTVVCVLFDAHCESALYVQVPFSALLG